MDRAVPFLTGCSWTFCGLYFTFKMNKLRFVCFFKFCSVTECVIKLYILLHSEGPKIVRSEGITAFFKGISVIIPR